MRFLLLASTIAIVFVLAASQKTLQKELTDNDVAAALKIARDILSNSGGKSRVGINSVPPKHTYVKFSVLTEQIGSKSNENILAYEYLLGQGYSKEDVLKSIGLNRPAVCTQRPQPCDATYPYRTINGTCNNVQNPLWGSLLQPFRRLVPNTYSDGFNQPRGGRLVSNLPNARLISSVIHPDLIKPDPSITNMVPQFGQFLDHDMTLTPEGDKSCCGGSTDTDCWAIPIYANDTFYSKLSRPQSCLAFTRSTPYCFPTNTGVREQMNILTAFVDASQVYGSDSEREFQLREFSKGRLRVSRNNPNLLPLVHEVEEAIGEEIEFMGDFLAGDERVNEMPALATMHTLMVREHNRIANEIYQRRPTWSDEIIFQETRRLVIAEWQNVVYGEYLPVILGQTAMNKYGLSLPANTAEYSIYNPSADATIFHSFATAAYRFGHTLINGLIRLMNGLQEVGSYKLRDNFFVSKQLTQQTTYGFGYDLILGGLMTQNAQTYDECVTEDLTNFLLRDANSADDFGSDLIARNLQRGRDHGLQPYAEYRKLCGLSPLTTWANRPSEFLTNVWNRLSTVYNSPSDIDLFTGGLSEYPVFDGVSGPTFNCLKGIQFNFAKDGDRFFFTHSVQPRPFNAVQLQNLRGRTLGDIICDNSGVEATPRNVFRTQIVIGGVSNPRINCNNPSRTRLNVANFV